MKAQRMSQWMLGLSLAAGMGLAAAPADAAFDLQITEMWPGQAGDDITEDWYEITNYGDTAWVSGVDLDLRTDDGGNSFANSVLIENIASIAPGESVIVLMEGDASSVPGFYTDWSLPGSVKVGFADGSGLGMGGSDGASLFLSDGTPLDAEAYVNSGDANAQSWDVLLGAYSTIGNASGAYASTALGGDLLDTPAIASPGIIPEPASLALLGLGGLMMLKRRR